MAVLSGGSRRTGRSRPAPSRRWSSWQGRHGDGALQSDWYLEKIGMRGASRLLPIAAGVLIVGISGLTAMTVISEPAQTELSVAASPSALEAQRSESLTVNVRDLAGDIAHLGMQLDSGEAGWLARHSSIHVQPDCQVLQMISRIICRGLRAGDTATITITGIPMHEGTSRYALTLCDCNSGDGSKPIIGSDGARINAPWAAPRPVEARWVESVQPEPIAAVSVTDANANPIPGATVMIAGGTSSARTAETGLAQIHLGPVASGNYTVVATADGYLNGGIVIQVPEFGSPSPHSIQLFDAPPVGTFVYHWKSTDWYVLQITGANPRYTFAGYEIEWHCYGDDWTSTAVSVTFGENRLEFGSLDVPFEPGQISRSFVPNGTLPDTTQPAPTGTCINGQNAW